MLLLGLAFLVMLFFISPLPELILLLGCTFLTILINLSPLYFSEVPKLLADVDLARTVKTTVLPTILNEVAEYRFLSAALGHLSNFSVVELDEGAKIKGLLGSPHLDGRTLREFGQVSADPQSVAILSLDVAKIGSRDLENQEIFAPGPIIVHGIMPGGPSRRALKIRSGSFIVMGHESTVDHLKIEAPVIVVATPEQRAMIEGLGQTHVLEFGHVLEFTRTTLLDLFAGKIAVEEVPGLARARFGTAGGCQETLTREKSAGVSVWSMIKNLLPGR